MAVEEANVKQDKDGRRGQRSKQGINTAAPYRSFPVQRVVGSCPVAVALPSRKARSKQKRRLVSDVHGGQGQAGRREGKRREGGVGGSIEASKAS